MWTPSNPEFVQAIIDELGRHKDPMRYGALWEALHDRIGSKRTFNLYLQMLVVQGIVKREARRRLPGGRWITVKRSRWVKYSLAKTSPISPEAPAARFSEWVEDNLRKSRITLLEAIRNCLRGDGDWKDRYSEFEKTMRLNLDMWWNYRNRFGSSAEKLLKEIEKDIWQEKRQLRSVSEQPVT